MTKRKIFFAGSAGMMCSHFIDYTIDNYGDEYEILGIDDFSGSYRDNVNPNYKFTELDLRDSEKVEKYFYDNFKDRDLDYMVLTAAAAQEIRSYFSPYANAFINDDTAKNCIFQGLKYGVKHIVYLSSMSRYGDGIVKNGDGDIIIRQQVPFKESYVPSPQDPYACSKIYIENLIKALQKVHDFTYTIWVPHNAYSPRQYVEPYRSFIAIWMNLILMDKRCYIYDNGHQQRAISWVSDYNPIICESIFNEKTYNQTINIGGDIHYSLNQLYEKVCKVTGYNEQAIHIEPRPGEVLYAYTDHTKAKNLTGFENKTTIDEALKEMWDYFKFKGPRPFNYIKEFEIDSPKIPKTWKNHLF